MNKPPSAMQPAGTPIPFIPISICPLVLAKSIKLIPRIPPLVGRAIRVNAFT